MTKRQTLYRMYAADGTLLYVGITQRRMERFRQHADHKQWWAEVAQIQVAHYPDRQSVVSAERAAIESEQPRYNVIWNGRRQSPPPTAAATSDGYGYGASSGDRWRPESLTCTVLRKRGPLQTRTTELVLWWELDYDSITDDYLPGEADCFELFDEWERQLRRRGRGPDLPVWWFVIGPNICEHAGGHGAGDAEGFTSHYYLGDAAGNYQMEVDVLPVAAKRWTTDTLGDKGGFVQEATGWQPSPLQHSVSLDLLRRRMWARRG